MFTIIQIFYNYRKSGLKVMTKQLMKFLDTIGRFCNRIIISQLIEKENRIRIENFSIRPLNIVIKYDKELFQGTITKFLMMKIICG